MTTLMDQQGPFIPFEKPVPVPLVAADADPLVHVCFNASWSPLVVGALKVLCRPETYDGTDLEVNFASRSAHELISGIESGCGSDLCSPVFLGTATSWADHENTPGSIWSPTFCLEDPCASTRRVVVGNKTLFLDIADQALQFEDNDTGLRSGVHICEFFAWCTDGTLTPVWNFDWEDCLGASNNELQTGAHFLKTNFIMQRWGLSCLGAYSFYLVWDGPILCTEV